MAFSTPISLYEFLVSSLWLKNPFACDLWTPISYELAVLSSFISSKKEVKIESLENAIDELKYESESSSDGDAKKLREFLNNMNDLE